MIAWEGEISSRDAAISQATAGDRRRPNREGELVRGNSGAAQFLSVPGGLSARTSIPEIRTDGTILFAARLPRRAIKLERPLEVPA
jgi:hypothetical protein